MHRVLDMQSLSEQTAAAWSGIGWSPQAFAEHLSRVRGDQSCLHPEDLYLAGAAGYRYERAWEAVHHSIRKEVVSRLSSYKTTTHDPEDLWSAAVLRCSADDNEWEPINTERIRLQGRKPAKIIRYSGGSSLQWYFLVICRRVYYSLRRSPSEQIGRLNAGDDLASREQTRGGISPEVIAEAGQLLQQAMAQLTPEHRALISMVCLQGLTRTEAASVLNWKGPYSATRAFEKIAAKLNEALEASAENATNKILLLEVMKFVRRCLQD